MVTGNIGAAFAAKVVVTGMRSAERADCLIREGG